MQLGYSLESTPTKAAERMPIASSTVLTDREKFERLGFGKPVDTSKPDQFVEMFADSTIDIQTGALLGRYMRRGARQRPDVPGLLRPALRRGQRLEWCRRGTSDNHLARIEALLEQLVAKLPG